LPFGKDISLKGKIHEKTNFVFSMPIFVISHHVFDPLFSVHPLKSLKV